MAARRILLQLVAAVVTVGQAPAPAHSQNCQCDVKPELAAAVAQSSLVFVGRVIEVSQNPLRPKLQEYKLKVLEKFRGGDDLVGNIALVYTPMPDEDCAIRFIRNLDYLIFATGNPASYRADACTRSTLLDDARIDVEKLRRLSAPLKPSTSPLRPPSR